MSKVKMILKEVLGQLQLIWTVSWYNNKASVQGHRFGMLWEIFDPLIQVGIYFFIFGMARDMDPVLFGLGDRYVYVPFFPWMITGMTAWMFMRKVTLDASKSVKKDLSLVSKMQFPMSVMPAMTLASQILLFSVMTVTSVIVVLIFGFVPTLHMLQFVYYTVSMFIFIYFFALLNSTLIIMFPDYSKILKPFMRFNMFFAGVIWRTGERFPAWFAHLMDLNPFSYIVTGMRYTFFGQAYFWQHWETTLFFWALIVVLAIVSSHLHLKLRAKFVDLV